MGKKFILAWELFVISPILFIWVWFYSCRF